MPTRNTGIAGCMVYSLVAASFDFNRTALLFHQKDLTPLTSTQEATTFFLCSGYCVRLVVWDSATLRLPVLAFLHRVFNTITLRLLSSHKLLAPAHDVPDCCTANSADLGNTTATPSRIGYTYPSATPTGRGAHVLDSIGAADPRAWHVRCRRPSVRIYTRRRDRCRHCLHGVPSIAFCYTHHDFCSGIFVPIVPGHFILFRPRLPRG